MAALEGIGWSDRHAFPRYQTRFVNFATEPDFLFHQWNRGHPVLESVAGDTELQASWAVCEASVRKLMMTGELFDLAADPGESRNLAASDPETARRLRQRFEEWFADVTRGQVYARVPIEVGRPDENPVEIDVTWGEAVGQKVRPQYRNYNLDIIDQWSVSGDSVSWALEAIEAGRYEGTLNYGCRPGDGGTLKLEAGNAVLRHEAIPTAGREVFRPFGRRPHAASIGPAPAEAHRRIRARPRTHGSAQNLAAARVSAGPRREIRTHSGARIAAGARQWRW